MTRHEAHLQMPLCHLPKANAGCESNTDAFLLYFETRRNLLLLTSSFITRRALEPKSARKNTQKTWKSVPRAPVLSPPQTVASHT